MRWTGAGQAAHEDPRLAGSAAAEQALGGRDADLVVVFAATPLSDALAGVRRVVGPVPLVGCSSAGGVLTQLGEAADVVVAGLGGGYEVATAFGADVSHAPGDASRAAAAALDRVGSRHRILLLLGDPATGKTSAAVRGVQARAGAAVPLVGGFGSAGFGHRGVVQAHAHEVLDDALVAAAIGAPAPFGVGVAHGWHMAGSPLVVGERTGAEIVTLDDEPALDAYLATSDAPGSVLDDLAGFARWASVHPLGLPRRHGEPRVISVVDADPRARTLRCASDVPRDVLTWPLVTDADAVAAAGRRALAAAVGAIDGPPVGLLTFEALSRRQLLDDVRRDADLDQTAPASAVPLAGLHTDAEIARACGSHALHHCSIAVLALP